MKPAFVPLELLNMHKNTVTREEFRNSGQAGACFSAPLQETHKTRKLPGGNSIQIAQYGAAAPKTDATEVRGRRRQEQLGTLLLEVGSITAASALLPRSRRRESAAATGTVKVGFTLQGWGANR